MKNRTLAWAALAALAFAAFAGPAEAQLVRLGRQTLQFNRTDNGATYSTPRSDGNHVSTSVGVNVAPQDTATVSIPDHAFNWRPYLASAVPPGALADSMWAGTLTLRGSVSTIDSLTVLIDRGDGYTWAGTDSIGAHVVTSQTVWATGLATDSCRYVAASTSTGVPGGTATSTLVLQFWGYSPMQSNGVTAQSWGSNVRALRFRIHMSPGDYAAAGITGGVTGEFVYPSFTGLLPGNAAP